jgi:hypothetical protein
LATGCSVLAELDAFQRTLGEGGGGSSADGGSGGVGGSGGQAGGTGGVGGSGGDGGSGGEGPITGYEVRDSLVQIRNACMLVGKELGSVLHDVDEAEAPSPLAPALPGDFAFEFYGEPVKQVWAGSNGYIAFGMDAPAALTAQVGQAQALNESLVPQNAVLPFWDELRTNTSGVCYAVTDEKPYRTLWITWDRACFADNDTCDNVGRSTLTFSVGLEETTQYIYVGYLQMDGDTTLADRAKGDAATIGVRRDGDATGCIPSECSTLGLCNDGSPCNYTQYSHGAVHNPLPTLEFRPHRMTGATP